MARRKPMRTVATVVSALWSAKGGIAWALKLSLPGGCGAGAILAYLVGLNWWQITLLALASVIIVPAVIWTGLSLIREITKLLEVERAEADRAKASQGSIALTEVASVDAPVQALSGSGNQQAGGDIHNVTHYAGEHPPEPAPTVSVYGYQREGWLKLTNNGARDTFSVRVQGFLNGGAGDYRAKWDNGAKERIIRNGDDATLHILTLEPIASRIGLTYYPKSIAPLVKAYFKRIEQGKQALVQFVPSTHSALLDIGVPYSFRLTVLRDLGSASAFEASYGVITHHELLMPCNEKILEEARRRDEEWKTALPINIDELTEALGVDPLERSDTDDPQNRQG